MIVKLSRALLLAASLLAAMAVPVFAEEQLPEPIAPQHATLENGRIDVYIGTTRSAAYQIGDSIPIRLVLVLTPDAMWKAQQKLPVPPILPAQPSTSAPKAPAADDSAKIEQPTILAMPMVEVEGLKMSVVTDKPSDVEPLVPATEKRYMMDDGRMMVVADLYVTTYVTTTKKQVGVVADFTYAIDNQADGQPNWHGASTPELQVGITTSATDSQTVLKDGDLSAKESPRVPAASWLLFGSMPLAIPMLVAFGLLVYGMIYRERELTENESTWVVIDQVVADAAAAGGFGLDHYRRIFFAVRERLDVLGLDTTQTIDALGKREDLARDAVDYVFNRETLFFDSTRSITAEQHEKFMANLAILIPRQ